MANVKITELTELTSTANADVLPIVDDTTGTPITKKVTVQNLVDNNTNVAANTVHTAGDGSDHADVATNTSSIATLNTDKADKSNVLELDNVSVFTPDADYEPATKKYVDDNAGGAPEGTAVKSTGETGGVKFLREDGDGTCSWQTPTGSGDMLAATYDPTTVAGDAFDMDNMVEGTTTKILTDTERTKLTGIEAGAEVNTINSDPTGVTGADQVTNVMSLTQAEYDAITPNASTFYIITT